MLIAWRRAPGCVPLSLAEARVTRVETTRYIFRNLWPRHDAKSRWLTLASFALVGAGKFAQSATPKAVSCLMDTLSNAKILSEGDSEDWDRIMRLAVQIAGLEMAQTVCRELRGALYSHVVSAANKRMATELFTALQQVELNALLRQPPAELASLVLTSSRALGGFLSNLNRRVIPTYLDVLQVSRQLRKLHAGVGAQAGDAKTSARIARVAQSTVILYFAFSFIYGDRRANQRILIDKADSSVRRDMQESLQNAEVVRACDTVAVETETFNRTYGSYELRQNVVQKSLARMNIGQQAILRSGILAATMLSADQVFRGSAKVGTLAAAQHIFHGLIHPLHFAGTMYRELKTNFRQIQSGLRILKLARVEDGPNARPLVTGDNSILVRNVSFAYPPASNDQIKQEVLSNINMAIPSGSTVALVGPSGGGKSTLLRILLRFYRPTSGHIEYSATDIADVTLQSLREATSLVSQETLMLNATLRDNLLYGCRIDDKDVDSRLANIIEECQLTDVVERIGLDGLVGDRGGLLSGGERQRVAIARALLRKAKFIFLDEPTAQLDAVNEQKVMQVIKNLRGKATIIMVVHKLALARGADQVFLMRAGMIRERGTHDKLLDRNGEYAAMWRAQVSDNLSTKISVKSEQSKPSDLFCAGRGSECCGG